MARQGGLYNELVAKIAAKLQVQPEAIVSLMFDGTDVSIEDDSDVLQLQEGETVLVTSTKDEDDEDLPDSEELASNTETGNNVAEVVKS